MTELERQQAAYKAARDRLYNPKSKPTLVEPRVIRVVFAPAKDGSKADQALAQMPAAVVRKILWDTFFFTGVTPAEVLGLSRQTRIVRARQHAMARVYAETQMSMPAVGRAFNRDHTTVMYNIKRTGTYVPRPKPVCRKKSFIGPRRPPGGSHNFKLTAQKVSEIRQIYAAGGLTMRKIAILFGIARQCVSDVTRRKTWKHVS